MVDGSTVRRKLWPTAPDAFVNVDAVKPQTLALMQRAVAFFAAAS